MMRKAMQGMLVLLMACETNAVLEPGQTNTAADVGSFGEEEALTCQVASRTPLDVADSVEVGYADSLTLVDVATVFNLADDTFEETLAWSDGTETQVFATLEDAATAELVVTESVDGPGTGACPTYLAFTVTVDLTTDDGRMDDPFTGNVVMFNDRMTIEHRITAPGGSIDVSGLAQSGVSVEPDELRVNLSLSDNATRFSGQLLPQPIGGIDDDAVALGSWPLETLGMD